MVFVAKTCRTERAEPLGALDFGFFPAARFDRKRVVGKTKSDKRVTVPGEKVRERVKLKGRAKRRRKGGIKSDFSFNLGGSRLKFIFEVVNERGRNSIEDRKREGGKRKTAVRGEKGNKVARPGRAGGGANGVAVRNREVVRGGKGNGAIVIFEETFEGSPLEG